MANIYIALLFGTAPFFRLPLMPEDHTTLAIMQAGRQQAGGRLKGLEQAAGRQFGIEYRSTLIIRDFSRLFPYDKQLIIRIRYDTEQKENAVRHRKTDSHKMPGTDSRSRSPQEPEQSRRRSLPDEPKKRDEQLVYKYVSFIYPNAITRYNEIIY